MKKNMEQANYVKAIITGILAFLSSLLGILAIPCGLMVSSNLVDYGTGLIASKFRNQDINSYRSIKTKQSTTSIGATAPHERG